MIKYKAIAVDLRELGDNLYENLVVYDREKGRINMVTPIPFTLTYEDMAWLNQYIQRKLNEKGRL